MDFPKLLVLTHEIPQSVNAGSLQLYRVLGDYPSDRLLVLGPPPHPEASTLPCRYGVVKPFLRRLNLSRYGRIANILKTLGLYPLTSLHEVESALGDFKPEVVMTVMDCYSYYELAYLYAKKNRLPLLTITMDKPDDFEPVPSMFSALRQKSIRSIYQYASINLGVSVQMKEYIASFYKANSDVLYFCIPEGLSSRPVSDAHTLKKEGVLHIGYAGSITLGYGEQLASMRSFFESQSCIVNIYSRSKPTFCDQKTLVYKGGFSQYEVWEKIKQECDAVILPYYRHWEHAEIYRTHFPTKLSEYLTLGMPVLVIGPEYATGLLWSQQYPQSILVDSKEDLQFLKASIEKLISDAAFRKQYSTGPLHHLDLFLPEKVKSAFLSFIRAAAQSSSV